MEIEKNVLIQMFRKLSLIRMVGKKIIEEYPRQEIKCPVHLSIGQEGSAVGISACLRKGDVAFSNHRCHAHYLAMGGSLNKMIAELYGRKTGCTGGWGGSMHLTDKKAGLLGSSSIVSGSISIAVGAALAIKMQGKKNIALAFFGDGAAEEGVFYESMNFASMLGLPIVFVCENNMLAVDTPLHIRQPNNIYKRGGVFGIKGVKVQGQNVMDVYRVANNIIEICREKNKPFLIECLVQRWTEHVNTAKPLYKATKKCPIRIEKFILRKGLISAEDANKIHSANKSKIVKAFKFAKKSQFSSLIKEENACVGEK